MNRERLKYLRLSRNGGCIMKLELNRDEIIMLWEMINAITIKGEHIEKIAILKAKIKTLLAEVGKDKEDK